MYDEFDRPSPRDRSRRTIQQLKPEVIAMAEAIREAGHYEGRSRVLEEQNARMSEEITELKEKLESKSTDLSIYQRREAEQRELREKAEEKLEKLKKGKKNERRSRSKNS